MARSILYLLTSLPEFIFCYTGGAFFLPLHGGAPPFWQYTQTELKRRDINVGVAILNYSEDFI